MKIRIASDLHVDINDDYGMTDDDIIYNLDLNDVDMLILAGDTGEYPENLYFIQKIMRRYPDLKIIEIPGNHLYYSCLRFWGLPMDIIDQRCREFARENKNYYFLNTESVVIDDIKFIGATMWTKCGQHFREQSLILRSLNDFKCVLNENGEFLTINDVVRLHKKQRRFIITELNKSTEKCVIITHHAPFFEYYSDLSHAFGIDLNSAFKRLKHYPEYWVFGHTHINGDKTFKYKNGEVKCVTNQLGYRNEQKYGEQFNAWSTFDGKKYIEV